MASFSPILRKTQELHCSCGPIPIVKSTNDGGTRPAPFGYFQKHVELVPPLYPARPHRYLDIKSPYAFIAWQPTARWARRLGLSVDWRPLTLDIPSYLGSARVDDQGNVLEQDRSEAQWAWVRYAYKDARRYAALEASHSGAR